MNGCQFFITCQKCDWLDGTFDCPIDCEINSLTICLFIEYFIIPGKHVVFGKVIDEDSLLVVRKIENIPVAAANKPKIPVTVDECGEL